MLTLLLIIVGVLVLAIVLLAVFLLKGHSAKESVEDRQVIGQRFDSLNISMNQMKDSVGQALRDTLKIVNDQLKDSRESVERSSRAVNQQVRGFTSGLTQLSENLKQVHESVKSVSSFQDIFKSPKLRGIWGEASLEASLAQFFPKDRYELQHYFKSGEAVDVILRLPNDLLLPIDSKFNWENFQKMVDADNDIQREQYKKTFFSDVKKKIDEISSKYILPSESTTDFALMYVPAETVYYEIINNIKDVDIPSYARSKKVILISPNTFFLSVSAINHWMKDVQLSKETKNIMRRLDLIAKDAHTLSDEFRKLGKHLSNAQGAYVESENRLEKMTTKVDNVLEAGDSLEKIDAVKQEKNLLN